MDKIIETANGPIRMQIWIAEAEIRAHVSDVAPFDPTPFVIRGKNVEFSVEYVCALTGIWKYPLPWRLTYSNVRYPGQTYNGATQNQKSVVWAAIERGLHALFADDTTLPTLQREALVAKKETLEQDIEKKKAELVTLHTQLDQMKEELDNA